MTKPSMAIAKKPSSRVGGGDPYVVCGCARSLETCKKVVEELKSKGHATSLVVIEYEIYKDQNMDCNVFGKDDRHRMSYEGARVVFVAALPTEKDTPAVTYAVRTICDCAPNIKEFTMVCTFFGCAQNDRSPKSTSGKIVTSKLVAEDVSNALKRFKVPTRLAIVDMHNPCIKNYFTDVPVAHIWTMPTLLADKIKRMGCPSNVTIVYPDQGSYNRFHNEIQEYVHAYSIGVVICGKTRVNGQVDAVSVLADDAPKLRNKHVLIVDDIVQSGSTLAKCSAALQRYAPLSCAAVTVHAVLPDAEAVAKAGEMLKSGTLSELVTSDSNPDGAQRAAQLALNKLPVRITPIAAIIAGHISSRRVQSPRRA